MFHSSAAPRLNECIRTSDLGIPIWPKRPMPPCPTYERVPGLLLQPMSSYLFQIYGWCRWLSCYSFKSYGNVNWELDMTSISVAFTLWFGWPVWVISNSCHSLIGVCIAEVYWNAFKGDYFAFYRHQSLLKSLRPDNSLGSNVIWLPLPFCNLCLFFRYDSICLR